MRFVSSNSDTSWLSDSPLGLIVKLKLVVSRYFFPRSRRWQVTRREARGRYRDCPVLEIATTSIESVGGLSINPGEYVCSMREEPRRETSLYASLFVRERLGPGELKLGGVDLALVSRARRRRLIRSSVGFVSPAVALAPELSVKENVRLPLLLGGMRTRAAEARAEQVLAELSLGSLSDELPRSLSDLELQLVELARGAVGEIALLILEDFPLGMSSRDRTALVAAAWRLARARGIAVLHDSNCLEAIPYCDVLRGGRSSSAGAFPG